MADKNNIVAKLMRASENFQPLIKESDNPFFNSKYADLNTILNAIKPALRGEGLWLYHTSCVTSESPLTISVTSFVVDGEGGSMSSTAVLQPKQADPQAGGSLLTYGRRYSLTSLLGLEAEDDDANTATRGVRRRKGAPQADVDVILNQLTMADTASDVSKVIATIQGRQAEFSDGQLSTLRQAVKAKRDEEGSK